MIFLRKKQYSRKLFVLIITFAVASCVGEKTSQGESSLQSIKSPEATPKLEPILTTETESEIGEVHPPVVSPYFDVPVENVEVRRLEADPSQIELVIRVTLPDQCEYDFHTVENRSGKSVWISLKAIHPNDTSCAQTSQNLDYVLHLGMDMPESERGFSPGEYELSVNNFQTTFFVKE